MAGERGRLDCSKSSKFWFMCVVTRGLSNKEGAERLESSSFVKAQHCFLLHCYVTEQQDDDLSLFAYSHIITGRATVDSFASLGGC